MKRALVIRNVATADVPLDSLDNACVQACTANGFLTEVAVLQESEIRRQLLRSTATQSQPQQRHQIPHHPQNHFARPHFGNEIAPIGPSGGAFEVVVFRAGGLPSTRILALLKMLRTISRQLFLCVFSAHLVELPMGRYECFGAGASMVTSSLDDVHAVLRFIGSCHLATSSPSLSSSFTCPFCEKTGFTEDQLWRHCPLYHINERNREDLPCPICRQDTRGPFQVHLHNAHGPPGRGELPSEFAMRDSSLYSFALVVCHNRKYNSFLLVQEFANSGFWLPGGRIDSGENPIEAAIRETQEEAGVAVRITGLLKVEYHPKRDRSGHNYVRMRFIFYAEPVDCDQLPKSIPDYESAGATWCRADQVAGLPLRGPEPTIYFQHVAAGKPIFPIDMLHVSSTSGGSSGSSSSSSSKRSVK